MHAFLVVCAAVCAAVCGVDGRIFDLELTHEGRYYVELSSFGLLNDGFISVNITNVCFSSSFIYSDS